MIVKMHKYSFLVYHADYSAFLESMKGLGVLHIIESDNEPTEAMLLDMHKNQELTSAIAQLKGREADKEKCAPPAISSGDDIVTDINCINANLELLEQQRSAVEKELKLYEPWGNFEWSSIQKLKEAGVDVLFYQCQSSKYNPEWENSIAISVVSDVRGTASFVVFKREEDQLPEMDAEDVRLPSQSYAELSARLKGIDNAIAADNLLLNQYAAWSIDTLTGYGDKLKDKLQTEMAVLHTNSEADGALMLLEGFVPKEKVGEVNAWLEKEGVVYLSKEAGAKDHPPVLLKNNKFAKLFEPIGELFSLPAYVELDLTPFFAPFFMLFFGFCFGDAGYGLLLILIGAFAKRKVDAKFKPYLSLLQWLGVGTVIFGALTGSFLGMKLTDFELPAIAGWQKKMFSDSQMFNLALGLGFLQIMFGMVLKGINQIIQDGFKYSISTWSWIAVILSSVIFYATGGMMSLAHQIILGISALGIFVFNHPQRNVFVNVGAGLWDTYNMVTGVAGDILSYIRLFALGLSGGILGFVFNKLAFDLSPDIPVVNVIVTALILILGHSLNIFMSALGAFVHPMRLIFVEFFKNSGFVGGGKYYTPFSRTVK